ncbi:myb-related transcription factor, partner of profilin-like [Engraulis encrasicolus]|uniref:myb-related transcription factor, partner of profilin-like n=1 Tax=Engraulis encrasicolus TaxID=184585 RepID=UPI002FD16F2A
MATVDNMARNPTFTPQELNVLVDEVEKRREVIFSKFKSTVTNADKNRAWEEVADRVNAVGLGYKRKAELVRKKWRDYSSNTKVKAAALRREQQRTGGGPPSAEGLSPLEERVLGVLGAEALEGTPALVPTIHLLTARFPTLETPSRPGESPTRRHPPPPASTPPTRRDPPPPSTSPSGSPRSTRTTSLASPYPRRQQLRRCRDHCDCCDTLLRLEEEKVSLLRGIREELSAHREQQQRQHEETMVYRRVKLDLPRRASARPAGSARLAGTTRPVGTARPGDPARPAGTARPADPE